VKQIPFIGPAYESRSTNYSAQVCINWMLEMGKGKTPAMLIGTPGLTAPWVTLTGGGMRGFWVVSDSTAIAVCGGNVWKLTTAAASTLIGTIPDDARPVQIVGSGQDILITTSDALYSLTLTGTSAALIESNIGAVDFLDDHFVANQNTTNFFIWSDATTITFDPLNIQADNSAPDILVGLKVARRTMYLFGRKSMRAWYSSGAVDIPFSRIDGSSFEVGCVAKDSIAELDTVFWLGGDQNGAGSVWMIEGGAPKKISTPAIEFAINQWSDMTDAEAFTYADEGHAFYVLSSVSGNETWVYDISTGEWHRRAWLHSSGDLHRIRPRCHMYFAGKHLVGDWENGNIYEYSLSAYSDNGNPLVAVRACTTIQDDLIVIKTGSFQLDMDTGVGLTTGQGSDPVAMLRWSKDGGKTWSSSLWRSFGAIGEYSKRAIWRRIGGGRRMVFEVRISDPVKRNVVGAYFGN
jgi:hypothetical protein